MAWVAPAVEAIGAITGLVNANHQQQQAQQALSGPPSLTPEQQHLSQMLRQNAEQYLAPNYVQNFADQYASNAQGAIDQAQKQAAARDLAHLAALGRETGGAYNADNAILAGQAAQMLANAKNQGLQLGQQQANTARSLLASLSTNDLNAARQQQANLAQLAANSAQQYGQLGGAFAGYGLDYLNRRYGDTSAAPSSTGSLAGLASYGGLVGAQPTSFSFGKFKAF